MTPVPMTPGRQRLLDDCDRIEGLPPRRFDMNYLGAYEDAIKGECGSPACFAGWVRAWRRIDATGLKRVGEEAYGLGCNALFLPFHEIMADGNSAWHATPKQAAQAGRNLALYDDPMWEQIR